VSTTPAQPTYVTTPAVTVKPTVTKKPHHHTNQNPVNPVTTKPGASRVHQLRLTRVAANAAQPSAVGAAFDLGSGPTVLFAVLLAAAALLAVGGGLHRGRRR